MREINAGDFNAALFHDEIVPAYRPVVIRGLVRDWPVTRAAAEGGEALAAYLKRFDGGLPVATKTAPAAVNGRFAYDAAMTGFNYHKERMTVSDALDRLVALSTEESPPAFAIQSARARRYFPGFQRENRLPVLPDSVAARLWIGNAVTVAAHYDTTENIACCVAGRRRFTLFPPSQARGLYPGPFELTPAGPIVSMVDFEKPDLDRFPLFAEAMAASLVAELEPGDALYIPYLWWHHVRSLERINLLVNFWWKVSGSTHEFGSEALLLAMMAIKNLPESRRDAWRALFGHYVFGDDGAPGAHLPPARRGVQGEISAEEAARLRAEIARKLAPRPEPAHPVASRLRRLAHRLAWRR
ncbi:cupin-like domain-containing protein [Sphingomonas oligophenolica]|uniref:Cupin-like domain-containing protein n=1 Tax=Sphingomonas oligophenolica TaxID=301154 RepID=A0ABU9Y0J9_9SPHN